MRTYTRIFVLIKEGASALFKFNMHRLYSILAGIITAALLAVLAYSPWTRGTFAFIEYRATDVKQILRPELDDSKDLIVNVDIDDNSIDVIGRWPWNRSVHGELVEILADMGALYTSFDVEFYREQPPNLMKVKFEKEVGDIESEKHRNYVPLGLINEFLMAINTIVASLSGYPIDTDIVDKIHILASEKPMVDFRTKSNEAISNNILERLGFLRTLVSDQDSRFIGGVILAKNVILPFHWDKPETFDPIFHEPLRKGSKKTRLDIFWDRIQENRTISDADLAEAVSVDVNILSRDRDEIMRRLFLDTEEMHLVLKKLIAKNINLDGEELRKQANDVIYGHYTHAEDAAAVLMDNRNFKFNIYTKKKDIVGEIVREELNSHNVSAILQSFVNARGDKQDPEKLIEELENIYLELHTKYFPNTPKELTEKQFRLAFDRTLADEYMKIVGPISAPQPKGSLTETQSSLEPPLYPLLIGCKTTGYVTIEPDPDGILRRVPLVTQYENDGKYYPQMAFLTMLEYLGVDRSRDIEVIPGKHIILRNAKYPDGQIRTVTIPIDEEGRILINWAGRYSNEDDQGRSTFNHQSYAFLHEVYKSKTSLLKYAMDLGAQLALYYRQKDGGKENPIYYCFQYMEAMRKKYPRWAGIIEDTDVMQDSKYRAKLKKYFPTINIIEFLEDLDPDLELASEKYVTTNLKGWPPRKRRQNKTKIQKVLDAKNEMLLELAEYKQRFNNAKEKVNGKICIVGSTHTGSTDFKPIPIHPNTPGVMLHSNVMNMMLHPEYFLKPTSVKTNCLLLLGLALIFSFFASVLPAISGMLFALASAVAVLGIHTYLMARYSILLDTALPMASCFFVFSSITTFRQLTEGRKSRFLKSTFEKFISADYVAELIKNPDLVKLGGETRYMTAHFSDIQGFSTFSEILTPEKLVHVLNVYLTRMSDLIQDSKGTIDKYEGDAVIAFFNAPMDDPAHCENAIEAGLQEQRAIKEINEVLHRDGSLPDHVSIKARIGLNSGEMLVGNMGSEKNFNYTMMGDNVNLAARLEGANKPFGTYYMVGSKTYEGAKDKFIFRRLAKVIVMGRSAAEAVYEPFGRPGEVSDKSKEMIVLFDDAMNKFEKRKWDEAEDDFQFLAKDFSDPASKRYIQLIGDYRNRDLPESWNGEIELTEK
ncbi:CHASE2 domain-containing protein [Planctomycetota bacterium]